MDFDQEIKVLSLMPRKAIRMVFEKIAAATHQPPAREILYAEPYLTLQLRDTAFSVAVPMGHNKEYCSIAIIVRRKNMEPVFRCVVGWDGVMKESSVSWDNPEQQARYNDIRDYHFLAIL